MLNKIAISLLPLLMLLVFSLVACFLGYGLFLLFDGAVGLNRIISRVTQTLLILSIYPVMRWLNISFAELGFVAYKRFLKQMLAGAVLGIFTLLPVLMLSYALDIIVIDELRHWTFGKVVSSLLVTFLLALLISLLEEPMFRGVLISAYISRLGIVATIFISSFYYAILHFIKTKTTIPIEEAEFLDSFSLLLEAFQNLLRPENLSAFWALLMVGIFLAIMRAHLKLSLAWVVGCHAAWVWQIKMAHKITDVNKSSDLLYLISPYDGVIGPVVAIWLTLVLCAYLGYQQFGSKQGK
ncbi:CPBP family intramembrane metalloprotease domain-containing protein [Methylococcaceae bacterium HT1]|nr:CPBP family intramembrane metalloprotease domain-containing protein [Methylococcaceae bacterium HT1]TXL17842.1 CPBP family intramembrane metalloprotease domain-containing protein [Methylococcaceae bacterium HT3]TXL22917.1 CPBP family intramembrane metalloprotease domain-containing protein [Methylococcaceae bacterium HT2]